MGNARKRVKKTDIGYGHDSIFPTQLRKLLENSTQEKLAESLGVSRQAVAQWKDGNTIPDIYYLKKIAEFFNVSYEFLLDGISAQNKENVDISKELGLSDKSIKNVKIYQEKSKDRDPEFAKLQDRARKESSIIIDKMISSDYFKVLISAICSYAGNKPKLTEKNAHLKYLKMNAELINHFEAHNILPDYSLSDLLPKNPHDILVLHQYNCQKWAEKLIEDIVEKIIEKEAE